jgi:DNA polymerase-3 subunit delta
MSISVPSVYILHGEDEFSIAKFVEGIVAKLGDPSAAMMNVTRLDGRSFNFDELHLAVSTVPFLTRRRIVVLTHPLALINTPGARKKFIDLLLQVPPSTALLLVEYKMLTNERARKRGDFHWLEEWADANPERSFMRAFPLPKGGEMVRWIQEQADSAGGKFPPRAAALLASLVGNDTRLADQEIGKLLAYVNYARPVEPDDVENITAVIPEGDIFAMVDALGNQDGRRAIKMLHQLLERQQPLSIFGMVVRQFRLLLLAREVMNRGGGTRDVARELSIHPFVAGKITAQARHFTIPVLENVYHRLLDMDEAVKTGQMQGDLVLDTMLAGFTSQKKVS